MRITDKILNRIDKDYYVKKMIRGGAKIGKNFYWQGSYINPFFLFLIEIGDNVTLTHATILVHGGSLQHSLKISRVGKVKIGNNVFVRFQPLILPNVTIGNNVVIGAGSVVTKDIPNNSIAVGNPCRIIGRYDEFCEKHRIAMKTHPVYNTYHKFKSKEEVNQMQIELDDTWGYDE